MRSALTYMVNANPNPNAASEEHHAHHMLFSGRRKYVEPFRSGNQEIRRCWVPWEGCTTEKLQTANNSIAIFAPADDTMHAVNALTVPVGAKR